MRPEIKYACVGSVFVRQMHFKNAGDVMQGHSHPYDHLTLLVRGALAVESNGRRTEFKAGPIHIIVVPKNVVHRLIALEPDTVACCVHAIRDKETKEIFDVDMLPAGTPPWAFIEPFINDK